MALSLKKPPPPPPGPELRQLSDRQLRGLACAVCGAALRSTDRPRALGEPTRDRYGYVFTLWACAPVCRRRTPEAAPPPASPGGP